MNKKCLLWLFLIVMGCGSPDNIKGKKGRALKEYILSCEGTLTTEYIVEKEEERFSVRCEEERPQYIEL